MRFYTEQPNLHIIRERQFKHNGRTECYLLCKFDDNGELETNDPEVIRQLKNIYRHEEVKEEINEEVDEEVKEEIKEEIKEEVKEDKKEFKCKKCDFITDNMGSLMAHYKTHKKR